MHPVLIRTLVEIAALSTPGERVPKMEGVVVIRLSYWSNG